MSVGTYRDDIQLFLKQQNGLRLQWRLLKITGESKVSCHYQYAATMAFQSNCEKIVPRKMKLEGGKWSISFSFVIWSSAARSGKYSLQGSLTRLA